jgi:hypothetical protein
MMKPSIESTPFDWSAVEDEVDDASAARRDIAMVLRRFIEFALGTNGKRAHLIGVRLLVASETLYPGVLEGKTAAEIARSYGISKSDWGYHEKVFRQAFNLHVARSRSTDARRHMAEAQIKNWRNGSRKRKP